MPQRCRACHHPQRAEIAQALYEGASYRSVAARFGLTPDGVERHARNHLNRPRVPMAKVAKMLPPELMPRLTPKPPPEPKPPPALLVPTQPPPPPLPTFEEILRRVSDIADHMRAQRLAAAQEGARGHVATAAQVEIKALGEVCRLFREVQQAMAEQTKRDEGRWAEVVEAALAEIDDEAARAAVARRLRLANA